MDLDKHIYMDIQYADPKLFSMMESNYNLRAVVTCRDNRKLFDSEQLRLNKNCDRGTFKILVYKRLGMVIKIWKESKILKVFSTTITTRNKGRDLITVNLPKYIIKYQQHMGRGDS